MTRLSIACALVLFVAACASKGEKKAPSDARESTQAPQAEPAATDPAQGGNSMLTIHSSAYENEGAMPKKYTCEGQNVSPPISWGGVPEGTKSLALILDDPDAPDPKAPKMTWVHWVLYDIPPTATGLPEGVKQLPAGTREGVNDFKKSSYGGPCPPIGRHRYVHKLYALDIELPDLGNPTKDQLLQAMKGHVLAEARLIGTYQKGQ